MAEQFSRFVFSEENDVIDIVADTYQKIKCNSSHNMSNSKTEEISIPAEYRKKSWHYSIVLLDDMKETLEILREAIIDLFANEERYDVDIYDYTTSMKVIEKCSTSDIDVFVLDVARKACYLGQAREYDHFGYDLFKLLVYERPNTLVRSKFIFYSKLSAESIRKEFGQLSDLVEEARKRKLYNMVEIPEIDYLKKQTTSAYDVAKRIKEYLDSVYLMENSVGF